MAESRYKRAPFSSIQGTLGLAVAMGIGRFFYTPLLPLMAAALNWSSSTSSWIAVANYLGYLFGSLAFSKDWVPKTAPVYRGSLICSTLLLATMALTDNPGIHSFIRFLAGIASAFIFVCITQFASQNLHSPSLVGFVYGGVGLGITVSGIAVWLLGQTLAWAHLWGAAALISTLFSIVAWTWPISTEAPPRNRKIPDSSADRSTSEFKRAFRLLDTGYFFQGFGYIIIGTYLVILANPVFGSSAAAITWAVAGIAAIPSPYLWSAMAKRYGRRHTLLSCYTLQVGGAIAAIFGNSVFLLMVAAIIFGATFMGITMLTISMGVAYGINGGAARLTTWYSLGQVVGPAVIGLFLSDSIKASFIIATITIAIGMATIKFSRL